VEKAQELDNAETLLSVQELYNVVGAGADEDLPKLGSPMQTLPTWTPSSRLSPTSQSMPNNYLGSFAGEVLDRLLKSRDVPLAIEG